MAGRRHLLSLYCNTVVNSSELLILQKQLPPLLICTKVGKRSYSRQEIDHEKAPSTFEEFKRLEQEKEEEILEEFKRLEQEKEQIKSLLEAKERQGFVSQTVEKAEEGFLKATEDPRPESVKESFKEPVGVGDFRRKGD